LGRAAFTLAIRVVIVSTVVTPRPTLKLLYRNLKGLSHEMDLAFDDMYG
jgi:hypothetical protein